LNFKANYLIIKINMKTSPLKSNKEVDLSSDTITRDVLLLREKIQSPRKEIEKKQEEIRKLKKQKPNQTIQMLISNLSSDVKKLQREVDGYNKQIRELEGKLKTPAEKLSSEYFEINKKIALEKEKIETLETQLKDLVVNSGESVGRYHQLSHNIQLIRADVSLLDEIKKEIQDELMLDHGINWRELESIEQIRKAGKKFLNH